MENNDLWTLTLAIITFTMDKQKGQKVHTEFPPDITSQTMTDMVTIIVINGVYLLVLVPGMLWYVETQTSSTDSNDTDFKSRTSSTVDTTRLCTSTTCR